MPQFSIPKTIIRELLTRKELLRETEPDLIMDDPDKVAAFIHAGREEGPLSFTYLFNCAHICDIIKPGDTVLDLGCGPARQLGLVARLNPEVNFIGVDMSFPMLESAKSYIQEMGLTNVTFWQGDITNLSSFSDGSVDAVISTVALHHLPDKNSLEKTFSEVQRVLKKDGGVYLVDFGRLKSEASIREFAYQFAEHQDELLTLDYLYSLRAAFSEGDFKELHRRYLMQHGGIYGTLFIPFLMAVKSQPRRPLDPLRQNKIQQLKDKLLPHYQKTFKDLVRMFNLAGMKTKSL